MTSMRRIYISTTSCTCWEFGPPPPAWHPQYSKPSLPMSKYCSLPRPSKLASLPITDIAVECVVAPLTKFPLGASYGLTLICLSYGTLGHQFKSNLL